MKKLFSILVFILSASSIAQLGADAPWMQELMLQKNGVTPTYEEIKAAGESYKFMIRMQREVVTNLL